MTSPLRWHRIVPHNASLGYYAEGDGPDELRYVVRRYRTLWLLEIYRTYEVAGIRLRTGAAIDTDRSDTLALGKAVAAAYEAESADAGPGPSRLARAVERACSQLVPTDIEEC